MLPMKNGKDFLWPVEQIRQWISEGKTHAWIGTQLGVNPKLIYKVCKRHGIRCQRTGPRAAEGHPDWKGGRIVDKNGYILVYSPDHPGVRKMGSRSGRYVLEHRLVMEAHLGRFLSREEVVHHRNGNKQDNRIENLELFSRNSEHLARELKGRCPKWTDEGRQRILDGSRRGGESHRGIGHGAGERHEKPDPTTSEP